MQTTGNDPPPQTRILFIGGGDETADPLALPLDAITAAPLNVRGGRVAALVFRDPATGETRVFDRHIEDDLIATFRPNDDPRRKGAVFYDADTDTGWSADGVAVSGKKEFKGRRLARLPADEDVYWGVMKFWYPNLRLAESSAGSRFAMPAVFGLHGVTVTYAGDADASGPPRFPHKVTIGGEVWTVREVLGVQAGKARLLVTRPERIEGGGRRGR